MKINKVVWEYGGHGFALIRHKQIQDIDLIVEFEEDCLVVPENCIRTKLPIALLRQFIDNYEIAKADHLKGEEPPF